MQSNPRPARQAASAQQAHEEPDRLPDKLAQQVCSLRSYTEVAHRQDHIPVAQVQEALHKRLKQQVTFKKKKRRQGDQTELPTGLRCR